MFRRTRKAFAFFACTACTAGITAPAPADDSNAAISGVVDDAQTGLPLAGAMVRVVGAAQRATTGRDGSFTIDHLGGGTYRLRVERDGYQPSLSDEVGVHAGATARVTLAVQAAPSGATNLRTIGTTSTRATQSLQRSTAIYRTLSPETLLQTGTFRFGDALRVLPGVTNSIPGDTAALGDDINLQLRGIGAAETTATLDGHPIGYGIPGGFNYQLSPTFGLRNVAVYYGSSGTELTGYDAIGGIVDAQTIDPTVEPRYTLTTGAGTFGRLGSNLTATGTLHGRLGYAVSFGTSTLDGPFNTAYLYQPGAAYDPSATSLAVRNLAVYKDDSTATTRAFVGKVRYGFGEHTHLTFTSVNSSYWEDKTGNGDGDYLTPTVALLDGRGLLANKSPTDACPAGRFTATNANGTSWGAGPGGIPDGGDPCQTPQSYANAVAGLQGAGPAWQAFNFNDQALHFDTGSEHNVVRLDGFTNRYLDTVDRTDQLPFSSTPGDTGSYSNSEASATGLSASDNIIGTNNELGFGVQHTNYAYKLQRNGSLRGAPIVHERAAFVREAYHPQHSPFAVYGAAYFKRDTTTNSSYVDPRLSLVFTAPGGNDVVRLTSGATTTEPTANLLDQLFTPSNLVSAGGGGGINCSRSNAIGSAPSSVLRPERGVDDELSYGHRFFADSQVQFALYKTNVFDKIYSTVTPVTVTGTGFIDPATLAAAQAIIAAKCGSNSLALLGVSGAVNIGQLRAQGLTISGRQRLSRATFVDYDFATTSTVLSSVSSQRYLQDNLTIVPGVQLPRIPLHTLTFATDTVPVPNLDVRYTLHVIGENNAKRLGGYNYSDLRLSAGGAGPGVFSLSVFNVWQQNAFIEGYLNEGVPLALNAYAKPADYAPYTGADATERFGLPYRSIFFTYSVQVR
ncbi:MAG: TonB-dependent receptor [Candidatus Eremiobacteraeota bacterium]|nr:TonB-dependent receptor [Candidatus Eremiobacteraeota bacterium]MBC5804459.1 TonB-dependent receptor [Candidatus Eremiobacteraeota bacterium]MBC5821216.1 TonB-dependent receptor [Candidatus Eremiobacteraeota bacterium]